MYCMNCNIYYSYQRHAKHFVDEGRFSNTGSTAYEDPTRFRGGFWGGFQGHHPRVTEVGMLLVSEIGNVVFEVSHSRFDPMACIDIRYEVY